MAYFSIGLDKQMVLLYSFDMKLQTFSRHVGELKRLASRGEKKELTRFVADQFKQLKKKNLRVPVTLFHL